MGELVIDLIQVIVLATSQCGQERPLVVSGETADAVVWLHFRGPTESMHRRGALAMLGGTLVLGGTLGARAQPATNVRIIR